jgi:hypothetical protein
MNCQIATPLRPNGLGVFVCYALLLKVSPRLSCEERRNQYCKETDSYAINYPNFGGRDSYRSNTCYSEPFVWPLGGACA